MTCCIEQYKAKVTVLLKQLTNKSVRSNQ